MIFFEMIDKAEYGRELGSAAVAGNKHDSQSNQDEKEGKDDFSMLQYSSLQSNNEHIILLSIFLCKIRVGFPKLLI